MGAIYRFEPTRSGKIAKEMLEGYTGNILVDGYGGYDQLEKAPPDGSPPLWKIVFCWSHVRRHFFEVIENYPEATEVVTMIDWLFGNEHGAKSWDELLRRRNKP